MNHQVPEGIPLDRADQEKTLTPHFEHVISCTVWRCGSWTLQTFTLCMLQSSSHGAFRSNTRSVRLTSSCRGARRATHSSAHRTRFRGMAVCLLVLKFGWRSVWLMTVFRVADEDQLCAKSALSLSPQTEKWFTMSQREFQLQ